MVASMAATTEAAAEGGDAEIAPREKDRRRMEMMASMLRIATDWTTSTRPW
jgi:hypothetical protein